MYTQPFIVAAGREAYEMAGISPEAVEVVELYDYGPAEYIIPLEDLGIFGRGQTGEALLKGQTRYSGTRPINPSGGSTCGVAAGAVGAVCLTHVVKQIRGESGINQVKNIPKVGMVYDCGAGRDAVIHIIGE
jgi:acetyl-CoA C-acetyltransferase